MIDTKTIVFVVVLALGLLYGGWYAHGVYYGYKENQVKEVQEVLKDGLKNIEGSNAAQLEDLKTSFANIKTNTILKQVPVIVNNPIYKEVCSTPEGIDLLQKYKEQSNEARQQHRSTK